MENKELHKAIKAFTKAPEYFHSPTGIEELLTQEDIDLRNKQRLFKDLRVSVHEIVFRKLYEVSLLPKEDWLLAITSALYFLRRNSINDDLLEIIVNQLLLELNDNKEKTLKL